jgi:hypothetical protein
MVRYLSFDSFLLQSQQTLYEINMRFGYRAIEAHVTFTFFGFFGKNVTLETLLMHDLSGAGHFKALFGTRIGLYFRHITQY